MISYELVMIFCEFTIFATCLDCFEFVFCEFDIFVEHLLRFAVDESWFVTNFVGLLWNLEYLLGICCGC